MGEKVRLTSNRLFLKQTVSQYLAIRKLIESRDVGDIVAERLEDAVRAKAHTIRLCVWFYSVKEPPFSNREGKKIVKAAYNIPDVSKSKLTGDGWNLIKTACGGANGYIWGRFRATANLSNGRQMQIYGGTEQEAEQRLKALLSLSEAKLLTLTVAEEKKEGRRAIDKLAYKDSTRIYPAYLAVINSEKIQVESERESESLKNLDGKVVNTLSGVFKRKKTMKIPLWVEKEPSTYKDYIREVLRVRGVNDLNP